VIEALEPLLALDPAAWRGLPPLTVADLDRCLGPFAAAEEAQLGWYPADRRTYRLDRPSGGLDCFSRDGQVVLVETLEPPPSSVLEVLGPPSGVKPHEILVEGAYVPEWVYADRGLVLSVAEPFAAPDDRRVVRCRGVRVLASADEFGPEYHLAFEDRTSYR
jgi:hypothetical protein